MKLLLTSPDALIDARTGNFFDGIEDALLHFLELDDENEVMVVSMHRSRLAKIPSVFNPTLIRGKYRGSPRLIEWIKSNKEYDYSDFIILGANEKDLAQAANSKLLLLSAKYAECNNPGERFYAKDYGLPMEDAEELTTFFDRFASVENPWYYRLDLPPRTTVFGLTNSNTIYRDANMTEVNDKFKALLKNGKLEYIQPFVSYFLVSVYKIYKDVSQIDYWGLYPTSHGGDNAELAFFLKKVRQAFAKPKNDPLIIRHTPSRKRQGLPRSERIKDGCDEQFETLHINPKYRGKLEGKTICIIDDFTTYGTSCETVRNLFGPEKVEHIYFIAMGKYGKEYVKYQYQTTGDRFAPGYTYKRTGAVSESGTFNFQADKEFLKSIKDLV